MLNKLLVATTALTLTCASLGTAQEVDGTKFRSLEEGSWYHSIEIDKLVGAGAEEQEVYRVLSRIEAASGARSNPDQPDTIIAYGPGNWTYEFMAAGDAAMERKDYEAATAYYHEAAAPHIGAEGQTEALEMAWDAYSLAMETIGTYEEIQISYEDHSFTGHLHIPDGDGPFPILVMSNGSDISSVTTYRYYVDQLMPKGIAFLTLDVPGLGRSAAYDVADGRTEKLHVAAIEWAQSDPRFDRDNVFAQGISFGGNAAARLFAQHQDLNLAGVIYTCGPLNAPFMAPPQAYAHFPKLTIDGVKTRLGLDIDASLEEFAEMVRALSVDTIGAFDGDPIETPILAINTNDDPAAPLDEMDHLLDRALNAERVVFDMPGHCPPRRHREAIASAWITANLR
jgi:esterase FrsA